MISLFDWLAAAFPYRPLLGESLLTNGGLWFLAAIMLIARHGGVVGLALIAVGIAMRRRWGGWLALCFPLGIIVFGIWLGFVVFQWTQIEVPPSADATEIRRAR